MTEGDEKRLFRAALASVAADRAMLSWIALSISFSLGSMLAPAGEPFADLREFLLIPLYMAGVGWGMSLVVMVSIGLIVWSVQRGTWHRLALRAGARATARLPVLIVPVVFLTCASLLIFCTAVQSPSIGWTWRAPSGVEDAESVLRVVTLFAVLLALAGAHCTSGATQALESDLRKAADRTCPRCGYVLFKTLLCSECGWQRGSP